MSGKKVRVRLHANRIREKARGGGEIEEYAQEALDIISEDIEDALENEDKYSKTEISTFFDVPYMTPKEAQRDVYYLIGQALLKSGYHPLIEFSGKTTDTQKVFVYISWETKQDEQHSSYKDDFLKQITMKPKTQEQKYQEQYRRAVSKNSSTDNSGRNRRIIRRNQRTQRK